MIDCLPMPVSGFEKYFLTDDRPGYRMTFVVDHTFEGEVDREAFEAGMNAASGRHPMLNAMLERRRWGKLWWVPPQQVRPRLDWAEIDAPIRFPSDPGIDLFQEVGVRFFVRVGRGESRVIAQFHHACTDGVGAIQFLSDLFATYVRHLMPDSANLPELQPVDHSQLLQRGNVGPVWNRYSELWAIIKRTIIDGWANEVHAPVPIAKPAGGFAGTPIEFPGTSTRTLALGVHEALRKQSRRQGVTLHELLLRELLLSLADWNERQGASRPKDHLSIIVPANLRTLDHGKLSATNMVGYMMFHRAVAAGVNPERLLESIRSDGDFFKQTRFASVFNYSLNIVDHVPGGLKFFVNRNHCCGTAVLSSVGDPSKAISTQYPVDGDGNPIMANLTLTDINSAPPIRPLTRAAFTSWHYSKRQRLGVCCDPSIFSVEQADDLLGLFADRVVAQAEQVGLERVRPRRAA